MKKFKRLPYGTSNFESIRTENYAYVDKTRFIELLENETGKYHFFIRPRKFGKSLFFSTLYHYYDINSAGKFGQLFGDLYIGKNPTPRKNSYAVMTFNFSGLDTQAETGFIQSFSSAVEWSVIDCLNKYKDILPEADRYAGEIMGKKPGIQALRTIYNAVRAASLKLFVIIDEYDHFANDLIAMGGRSGADFYKSMIRANGMVRDFYEMLKIGTSDVLDRIFITGISPVMLDDLTSGFNIAANLTLLLKYNEMLGFTQAEVDALMVETGVDPATIEVDMKLYFDGYLFHASGANRVYNPSMILYFFNRLLEEGGTPREIIDPNLNTDYGRLQRLVQNEKNRETLINIAKDGDIATQVYEKFSIDRMTDGEYFVSLLFYLGLLTIKEPYLNRLRLVIPNFSVQTVYWDYIMRLTRETSPETTLDTQALDDAIVRMALDGEIAPFIDYISVNVFSRLSNRDLERFDEKYIHIMLLACLFQSRMYIPISQYETESGYTDIYLQANPNIPEIRYEWVLELKYCKESDAKDVPRKREAALEQLNKYLASRRFEGRQNIKAVAIVFTGKSKYEITEHA